MEIKYIKNKIGYVMCYVDDEWRFSMCNYCDKKFYECDDELGLSVFDNSGEVVGYVCDNCREKFLKDFDDKINKVESDVNKNELILNIEVMNYEISYIEVKYI